MNGILLVNKEKNITSRDVVNKVSKILGTKKVGHTGTLDPIASGVLVLCIGKYTKLVDIITSAEKEYYASAVIGIETDTLDITGNILNEEDIIITKEKLINTLNSFVGKYNQEVPYYSAVKINGKKLYEYARNNIPVDLPKRIVEIKNIKLDKYEIKNNKVNFSFYVTVSKGTYIRSLIRDIAQKLNTISTMTDLVRIKQGNFDVKDCCSLNEINDNKYKIKKLDEIFNYKIVEIDNNNYKKIINGCKIIDKYNEQYIMFSYNTKIISIYKKEGDYLVPFKMNLDDDI